MTNRRFKPVSWSINSNIYEVNLRQYSPEGTFAGFLPALPRLRDMGVDILWFMPVTPISREKRLGILGSYYACSDYTDTNPEFGTVQDFKNLVEAAHKLGFKVIIDWVANHTGWDHKWTRLNPGFYKRNTRNEFYDSHGWEDVIDLNYYDHALRREMVKAMRFWVETCNIDGFRCDMAHLVPRDFWRDAREELDAIRPLFWLAETDDANYFEVFDVGYAWNWMHRTENYFKGKIPMDELIAVLTDYEHFYPAGSRHLFFTTNHDENSWNGTEYEKYGDSAKALAVFCYTWNGIPLIYSGQEIPNHKRLKFFEKDAIDWSGPRGLHDFYKALNTFRKVHPVFQQNPAPKPKVIQIPADKNLLCYVSEVDETRMMVVLNFSASTVTLDLSGIGLIGIYHSLLDNRRFDLLPDSSINVEPWDALILSDHKNISIH